MNSTDLSLGSRPMSAKELTEKAKAFDWNPRIGFKYWARAAETIHHEVRSFPGNQQLPSPTVHT
jgi:STAM-binding protein